MALIFDLLNDVYVGKKYIWKEQPEACKKEYTPYVINRFIKAHVDCIFDVQEMNLHPFLDKELQYDYYIYSIKKKKRYGKYLKKEEDEAIINYIKEYFCFSGEKAEIAMKLLNKEQKEIIVKKYTQHLRKK